jgi:hypothetical protein
MSGKFEETTPENVDSFPGFDELHYYDYFFRYQGDLGLRFYYANFIDYVGSADAQNLTYIIPENSEGYDTLIYKAYFNESEENSGAAVGKYALAFINAVKKLPEVVDRFNKALVDAAINAFNALEGREQELADIDPALITRFEKARTEYNVSVVENLIAHLFDMDKSEYSFELVKNARASFMALTEDEKALVSNAATLTAKVEELASVMGVELDFDRSFADHFPEPGGENTEPNPPVEGNGMIVTIIIIAAAILVVAAATVVVTTVIIKKKRTV